MSTSFRKSLPVEFIRNTISLCGEKGERWLDSLPELISIFEHQWSLSVHDHFPNIGYNFVAPASVRDRMLAVLKIGLPLENVEIFSEAKYLRILNGRGAVHLLEEDRTMQAILIERALPGETMARAFDGRQSEAVAPAIEVLKQTLQAPPNDRSHIISLDEWFDGLRRFPGKQFPAKYGARALEIYNKLSGQPGRTFYLHGDFHPDNIVSASRSPFLVIDPKGIIGHLGYEIAVFLNNFHWWQEDRADIKLRIEAAIGQFSDAFDLDPYEIREWAFAQMVLSAWWTFDEMPDLYNNEVEKADIWDV